MHHSGSVCAPRSAIDCPLMAEPGDAHQRTRLIVLFGGQSAEHAISCVSASHVLRAADPSKYELIPIGITESGDWVAADEAAGLLAAGRPQELPESVPAKGTSVEPSAVLNSGATATVVLPILHGPNGEDGTVQGMLELAGIPYVGSGVLGSAVAMDKVMAKTVLQAHGIQQARWLPLARTDLADLSADRVLAELGPVVFVKPANMGSSIGISKVTTAEQLEAAATEAFLYDDLVVFEEGVEAREIECGVLGNDHPSASQLGEIVTTADFYDYEDKYFAGTSETVVPADLPADTSDRMRSTAIAAFKALRCSGMARVDMFLRGDDVLVNEVNTIPGFTPISMYPKMWQATGLTYSDLIDQLVNLALERHQQRSAHKVSPS